jgi:hypothetical protein
MNFGDRHKIQKKKYQASRINLTKTTPYFLFQNWA